MMMIIIRTKIIIIIITIIIIISICFKHDNSFLQISPKIPKLDILGPKF